MSAVFIPSLARNGVRLPRSHSLAIAAFTALIASVLPLLEWYARRLTDGSDEPLGAYALIAALGTIAVAACFGKRDGIRVLPGRMIGGAVLLALVQHGEIVRSPLLTAMLAITVFAVSIRMQRGKAGVIALLFLSLPLMASLDFYAGYPLRLAAAEITTKLLGLGGIHVERAGVLLLDGGRLVGIDPPCAGIRMLWTSCFVASFLSARTGLGWIRTLGLLTAAVACVVLGNGVRAALVFLPESGRVDWPDWAHPGVGLLVHGGVLATVFGVAGRLGHLGNKGFPDAWRQGARHPAVACLLGLVIFGGLLAIRIGERQGRAPVTAEDWPDSLGGTALLRQPLSPMEQRFLRSFPGGIAKFSCGDAEVIMRRTDRPTRMMHPSGDCLRAAGFEMHAEPLFRDADDVLWGASTAHRDGQRWQVHERYLSTDGNECTDASAWYWQALLNPDQGPWTAITVIRPDP
jgi:exosortase/archaeosortase family protein